MGLHAEGDTRVYDDADSVSANGSMISGSLTQRPTTVPPMTCTPSEWNASAWKKSSTKNASRRHYLRGWTRTIRTGPLDHSPERAGIGTFWRSCEDREAP